MKNSLPACIVVHFSRFYQKCRRLSRLSRSLASGYNNRRRWEGKQAIEGRKRRAAEGRRLLGRDMPATFADFERSNATDHNHAQSVWHRVWMSTPIMLCAARLCVLECTYNPAKKAKCKDWNYFQNLEVQLQNARFLLSSIVGESELS